MHTNFHLTNKAAMRTVDESTIKPNNRTAVPKIAP